MQNLLPILSSKRKDLVQSVGSGPKIEAVYRIGPKGWTYYTVMGTGREKVIAKIRNGWNGILFIDKLTIAEVIPLQKIYCLLNQE